MNEKDNYIKCEQAISLSKEAETADLELAKVLKEIRDKQLYQPQYSNFAEYLQEVNKSASAASRLISTHTKLVDKLGIPFKDFKDIGWSKAYEIAKNCTDKEEAEKYITMVKAFNTTKTDLQEIFREDKTGIGQMECEHEFVDYQRCKKCNVWEKKDGK